MTNSLTKILLLFGLIQLIFSCSQPQIKEPDKESITIRKKTSSSNSDSLFIRQRSVVVYNPDSTQLDKIRVVFKENIESIEHEFEYQIRNATREIKNFDAELPVIATNHHRYLVFIKKDDSKTVFDLNDQDISGMILYDPEKVPVVADMMNINTVLEDYFLSDNLK